jgi:tRNA-dihydrouridine synthase B
MLSHYGRAIGRRHARKHLGWALSAAAETAAMPDAVLKAHRARVLTADDPAAVRRHLADAYADFASRAHRGESDWACPQKTRHAPWGSERKAA